MELYCKWSCCFCFIRYIFLIGIHVLISNAILYSEDDLYTTNFTTTYSNIPSDCSLFGRKFKKDYPDNDLILNTTETGTYWVGAKIGFKRNLNPLGVLNVCNGTFTESLDDCNIHCKDWKYFSYKEHTCSCSNNNKHTEKKLGHTNLCKNPEHGLCKKEGCVVYERGVLNTDYLCGVYYHNDDVGWLYSTQNCSEKLRFICEGEKLQSGATKISWLEAEHICAKKSLHLLQNTTKVKGDARFEDGTRYWASVFRKKTISWGQDSPKTVCVAARIQPNGSYELETHFCNKSLEALCHKPGRRSNASSDSVIVASSLGTVLVGVLVVVAAIKNKRNRHLQNVKTNQQPLEDCKKGSTSTDGIMKKCIDEPMYSNTNVPLDDSAVYALAKDHSDPSYNKEVPDKQYDRVSYMEPRNTDADKLYDHIMENPYQDPYS